MPTIFSEKLKNDVSTLIYADLMDDVYSLNGKEFVSSKNLINYLSKRLKATVRNYDQRSSFLRVEVISPKNNLKHPMTIAFQKPMKGGFFKVRSYSVTTRSGERKTFEATSENLLRKLKNRGCCPFV